MERITSRRNPLISHIRKLCTSRSYRREQGLFVAEGPKLLSEALRWGAEIACLVGAEGEDFPCPADTRRLEVPADLLAYLSDTATPQGVVFLCRMPPLDPPGGLERGRYLALDGVQDPGNVGTIWRTADALGAQGVFLLPGCADPFSPKTVRASMGACFRLPVWETGLEGLTARLEEAGIPLYATALADDTADVREIDWGVSAAVIGSEGRGVSSAVVSACRRTVGIPMRARCESLNAAVAAAIVLWEGAR